MSRHRRSNAPVVGTLKPPTEIKSIGDKSYALWNRYFPPMQQAAQMLNAAIENTQNILGSIILEIEGCSAETYIFDADRMRIVPRSLLKSTGENNGKVGE